MSILNNALSGAQASQLALASSSQNIANLQTKGYTRQAALLSAVAPALGTNQAGNGVRVTSLIRFSDDYKTQQLWRAASDVGTYSQSQPYLTQLEQVMGDDQTSLSDGIDKFFSALNAVAGVDPTSTPLRQQVVTMAGLLAQRFNSMNNVYAAQLTSVNQQRTAIVKSANSSIAAIAALNTQIASAHALGTNVSALMDQRDQAIDSLASLVGLEISDQPDGTRNVSLKTGQALVLGGIAGTLDDKVDGDGNQTFSLTFAGTTFDGLDVSRAGGQLGGLSSYLKNDLVPLRNKMADMANFIAYHVNDRLTGGYKMDGSHGKPLFVYNGVGNSIMMDVEDDFTPADLGFSSYDNQPGDIGHLQQLIDIKNKNVEPPPPATPVPGVSYPRLSDADTQLVGELAVKSQTNKGALATAQTLRDQAMADWQSTSGVNQDEEAINLVEYQNMYQANMKVMSVANALFDATLAMMA